MTILDTLAVQDAILFQVARARLKGTETAVLLAIIHHAPRWSRLAPFSCSHSFLAEYSGVHPKRHGEPLQALHDRGFIEYRKGSPMKDGSGHRHTQSVIRVRVPANWADFRTERWRKVQREVQGHEDRDPSPPDSDGHELRDPDDVHPGEGHGLRDLPVDRPALGVDSESHELRDPRDVRPLESHELRDPLAARLAVDVNSKGHEVRDLWSAFVSVAAEGHEVRDLPLSDHDQGHGDRDLDRDAKVTEIVTRRSRSPLPQGHGDRDPQGHGDRDPEGHGVDTPNGEALRREDSQREDSSGKTYTSPPYAELTLDAASAAHGTSVHSEQVPLEAREDQPTVQEGSTIEVQTHAHSGELPARVLALEALDRLSSTLLEAGRKKLTPMRRDEIVSAIAHMLETDHDVDSAAAHYLLGFWAGDRALENANYLVDHMRRHKRYVGKVMASIEARGDGVDPEVLLRAGLAHGMQNRKDREAERKDEGPGESPWGATGVAR